MRAVAYHTLHFICNLTNVLRPKDPLTISEWAGEHMVLPEGSNASGKFSTDSMPFQKEIMDAITNPVVRKVSVMTSSQIGKTTIILCGMGYYADYEPSTQMIVMPTLELGERFSKTRLAPMIREIPTLRDKIASPKSKDSDNTILYKSYPGGYIVVAGSNSAPSLSSQPVRVVWLDEVDRFADSAGTEGNPVKLAEKRSTSYWNKKRIMTSTPTIAGRSKIEDAYNDGTMEEWCVECPCCGKWQPYDFRRVKFNTLSMECIGCQEDILEMDWKESPHKWIARCPERLQHRTFRMNELASPLTEWKEIIGEFLDAKRKYDKYHDTEDLKVFVNTVLGEVWDETSVDENEVDHVTLQKRAETYDAEIPDGVIVLTAAIDVQDNRFEVEVKGWGRNYENWGIYKTEIYGNLAQSTAWEQLEEYLETTFYFKNGCSLNIAAYAIDTGGHFTNRTYQWIKKMRDKGKRIYGIKGYAQKTGIPLLYKRTVVKIKKVLPNGKEKVVDTTVIDIVGTDAGKEDIYKWLTIDTPGEGFCHFPDNTECGYDEEYYKGLFAEKLIIKKVRGVYKKVWVKKSGIRNEPLDLFNYNYVCIEKLRPEWDKLEERLKAGINYTRATKGVRKRKSRKSRNGLEV